MTGVSRGKGRGPGAGAFRVQPTASWSRGGLRPGALGLVGCVAVYLRPAQRPLCSLGREVLGVLKRESLLPLRSLSGRPWICYPRPPLTGAPSSFVSIVRVSPRASRFTRPLEDFLQPLFAPWGRTQEGWEGDCTG